MNKKVIIFFVLLIIPFVSANGFGYDGIALNNFNIGTFKQGNCIDLKQTCSNCTFINITSISYQGKTIIEESEMEKQGTLYNYTFCNTSQIGIYKITGVGDSNVPYNPIESWVFDFEITKNGRNPITTGEGIIYSGSLFAMFLFSIIFLFISNSFKVERETTRGEDGIENSIITKGNSAMRFGCLALSFVGLLFIILYSSISLSEILFGYQMINDSYQTFVYIFYSILGLMFLFVLITIIFSITEKMQIKRGLKE